MTTTDTAADNGVNLQALLDARVALGEDPGLAQFVWRTACRWENGTHTYSTIEKFSGLGDEQSHHTVFGYDVDHPECFAAEDHGPTPVELVLVGLAGCLTAGVASVAQMRGIQLRSVMATLEGTMDLGGVLGIDPSVRNGFGSVTAHFTIDADATQEDIEALVAQAQKRSAVYDVMANPTNIFVDVNR